MQKGIGDMQKIIFLFNGLCYNKKSLMIMSLQQEELRQLRKFVEISAQKLGWR